MVVEEASLQPKVAGQHHIVGIQEADILSPCKSQTPVIISIRAQVFGVPVVADPRVAERADNLVSVVGGLVVADHKFEIVEILSQYALNSLTDEPAVVESRNTDADLRM